MSLRAPYFLTAALVLALVAAFVPATASAQGDGATNYKIGVADFAKIMREYNKRVNRYDALQKQMDERQKTLDGEGQSIQSRAKAHNEKLQKDSSYRGSTEADAAELKIRQDEAAWRAKVDQEQLRLDQEEQKIIEECMKDIEAAISEIAQKDGYHLILDGRSSMVRGGVLFRAATIDVTSAVLAKLNGK